MHTQRRLFDKYDRKLDLVPPVAAICSSGRFEKKWSARPAYVYGSLQKWSSMPWNCSPRPGSLGGKHRASGARPLDLVIPTISQESP